MATKKNVKWDKLNDYITYRIIDSTLYLIEKDDYINDDSWKLICKKIKLLIEDNNISYINISSKNIDKNRKIYQELGFTISYYDVNKLNMIYDGIKDKKLYRTYGIITKNDFLNSLKDDNKISSKNETIVYSNSGFVSNVLLLFGGILLLCYFCVQGAIYLVK